MNYIVAILGIAVFGLIFANTHLLKKNAQLEQLSKINQSIVENQNKAILEMKLDSEKYHCDIDSLNEYTKEKYSKVIHEHENESCEAKLAEFEKALNIYGGDNEK